MFLDTLHIWILIFLPFPLGKIASALSDWLLDWGFLTHSNTHHSSTVLAEHFESLSCWKVNLFASLTSLAADLERIFLQHYPYHFPVLFDVNEKLPNMMLSTLCFIRLHFVFFFYHYRIGCHNIKIMSHNFNF